MNINQHFGNLVTKAAEEGADASQLITQRDRLFKDKVIPELVKRKANDAAIAQARLKFNEQTDTVMSNAGLLPKAGQSSRSFAKDKRAEKAIKESARTGSQWPIIKETIMTTGETVGNLFGQGVGGMIEGAAGFVRDIGENEKDSISAKTAKYGKDLRKGYESSASTYQKELQAGQHGKIPQLASAAIQSVPAMALPFGVAKGATAAAIKVPMLASKAPYIGMGAGLVAGHTQNYGEVRRNATANLERDFPTWEKLQGNPLYQQNFNKLLDSGVNINQARQQAHAETLDALSEGAADKYGTAMTALDFIAPSGAVLGSGILKNAPTSKIGKALVGGGVSSDLVRREMTQAPRVGMAKLIPDISKTANIAAAKMVGKQALEEGLQGGIGEYGAQAASANIGGQAVDYGKVGQTVLEEGLIGGIMGGGMQSGLGGSPTSQAKEVAKQLRNQTNTLRQEEAAARKELAQATQFNDPEKIESAKANLSNIGAEANKVKAAYDQYGIEIPHFVERFASQYQPQQQPQQQDVDPAAAPTPEAAPQTEPVQPAQPAPAQPTQVNNGMANTTNLVMDSVTKGLISPEEAQAIQTDPILGEVFSLVLSGDQAAAHNIVMNAVSLGNIDMNQAQNLIESIPRYAQLGQPQKPSLSGIVNDHVKQQIQPSQDGGLFSNAVDLDPNTLEPIDQNQPSPFQEDFNEPKQFMNPTRASDYVRENGLADSHELVRHDDGVIEVRPRQNSIPEDPNLNDFGYNPAQNMQPVAEDPNLTDFSDGAASVADLADGGIPEVLPVQENEQAAEPATSSKKDFSKPKIFSNMIKAKQYVKENQLEDTHEIINLADGRVQVQLKAEPVTQQKEEAPAPEKKEELAPSNDASFADQIRDAHINNPKSKAKLINDEIAKGRSRPEVLKEVADVVKSVNDSKPKEPEAEVEKEVEKDLSASKEGSLLAEPAPSETVERIAMPKQVSLGMGQLKTTPIDKPVYREMNLEGFEDLVRDTLLSSGSTKNLFVTDNIDLALGQGGNKGILVQLRGDAVSGKEHKKPMSGDLTGREYKTDFLSIDSIDQFILPKDTKLRSPTRRGIQGQFTYKKLDDGSILATRKGVTVQPLDEMRLDKSEPVKDQKTSENGIQENDAPDSMKAGDIGRGSDGKPFLSKNAANRGLKLRNVENTHEVVEIAPSSFVLREKAKSEDDSDESGSDEATPVQPTETKVEEDVQETKTSKVNVHEYGLAIDSKGDVIDFDSKEAAEQFILDNELGDKFHPGKMGDKYELHTDQYNAYERYKSNDPKINDKFDVKNLPKPDIGRASDNAPFSNESSANLALKKKGLEDSYAVARLAPSQFVLRDKSQIQDTSTPIDLSDPVKLVESIIADGRKVFDSGEQIKQGHEVTFTYKEKAAYGYARLGIELQKNDINEIITKLDHRIVMSDPYFSGGSKNLSSNHSFKYKYGLRNSGVKKLVISPMKNGDIKITATVDSDSKKMTRLKLVEDKPETKITPAPAEPVTDSLEFPLDKVKEAYGHAHLSPGNTARAFKESFDKFIQSEIDEAKPLATTEAQQVALDEAVIWVKDNYINKALPPLLNAASATVSSARAGRNNFNSKQANQRGSALDRATTQFDAELERLKGYAQLKVLAARTPEQKQADADAEIKIQEEKAAAEQAKVEAKLKAEEEAKANKKRASNEWITHPDTAEHMTMEEWKAIGKDYKGITDGVRRHMGVPVWITDEGKPKPKSESKDALKVGDTITFSDVFDYALPNEPYTIVTSTKAKLTLQTESGSQFSFNPKILEIEKAKNPDLYKTDTAKVEPAQPTEEPQASDYETVRKQFDSVAERLDDGEKGITIEEVQQAYKALMDNHESLVAELSKQTKQQLLDTMHPYYASMYKSYKKDELVNKWVSNIFRAMDFGSGGVVTISYGDKRTMPEIVRDKIEAATQEDLNKYLEEQRKAKEEREKELEAAKAGMNDPKIMDDFKRIYANGDFNNFKDFYRSLTLPQQALYDELKSGEANEKRMQEIERNKAYREASNPSHAVESTTDATLYAGKHTKKNTDIWTVALNGRVDGDAFNEYRSQAKSLGGYYSRYTGGGAVAGFIFEDEAKANEFLNLVTGDNEAKLTDPEPEAVAVSVDPEAEVEVIETDVQRRAEKLREKAQVIIDRGEQNINRDRKTNTSKRAGDAARAEEQANKSIFLGETLNRIADGIENGSVKYLSRLGAMTQLAHLESLLQRASYDQQRETNAKEREITANTISYTEFPQYKTWIDSFNNIRSDLKSANPRLAEKLEKTIGIRYHNAYARWLNETNEYGTENYVGQLARKTDGTPAVFKTNIKQAETLVKTVNKKAGKESFEVFKIKNGEYAVISSYTTAMENESWKPTNSDKQMTLTNDFGNELYNALKQHKRKNPSYHMNWLIESMYDSVSRMEKLGIHDPATYRAAMREYLNLRSKEKANDPIKEMERSMIGRSNDGLDFFPTPRNVVEQMIELADLDGDMKVLEPSAGMGHIADVLKDYGIKPDVIELSGKRQELLKLKGYSVVGNDFLMFDPKNRAPNYGDVFKTADGKYQGVMRGSGGLGSNRVRLMNEDGQMITYFDREELELVKMNGINYDRIIMNPPFSDRRDAEHIYHAFDLLADDGVMVAIAGEGVFFGKDKAAQGFQEWLDKVGAEVTPLDAGTFNDPSLPVTTGVKARIIKINKADSKGKQFSRSEDLTQAPAHAKDTQTGSTPAQVRTELVNRFGEDVISQLEQKGILAIVESHSEQGVEGFAENGKVTLVADAITPENIVPVFLHELGGHVGMQGVLKPSAYDNLMSDFDRLVKAGNPDALEAKRLAERETDQEIQKDEYLPYLITVTAKNQQKQSAAQRLVSRVLGAIKAWAVHKIGLNLKLNSSDILALAERMVKTVAKNPPPTPPKGKLKTDQTETEAFKKWFSDSKVIDESGKPKIVYHGTNQSFNIFNVSDVGIHAGTMDQANSRKGEKNSGEFRVMPLYMRINNPLRLKDSPSWKDPAFYIQKTGIAQHLSAPLVKRITGFYDELKGIDLKTVQGQEQALDLAMAINRRVTKELKAQGYDGIVYKNTHDGTSLENKMREDDAWIVFDPEQIKSATTNNGNFDSSNPDIRYSRSSNPSNTSRSKQRELLDAAAQTAFGQMSLRSAEGAKTLSNRTLNLFQTMLHKSLTDKSGDFKKTFDLVQGKINHVTFASTRSMDVAPNVLTQLEEGSDYWKEAKRVGRTLGNGLSGGKIEKAKIDKDLEKIGTLLFENTLLDNSERHTDKELRQLGFDDEQIGLYNEVREAIDTSLDTFANTTFSNIYKHLGGTNEEVLELEGLNLEIHEHYNEVLKRINALTNGKPEMADARQAAIEAIDKVFKKANDLKDEGYVPLMRFGKYFVRIYNPTTGEVAYRQHFESESERNMYYRKHANDDFPAGFEMEQGRINELQHKLFQGVSPETVALFAKESGLPIGDAEKAYIKFAVQNNHALKRLLRRQGIDGFDTDLKRVLAAFVMSNARYSANQTYNPAIDDSILNIKDPAYQEDAIRLRDYSLDTQEELAPVKNFAFVYYMGFSAMFGLVNLTQPFLQTLPYLMQYSKNHGTIFTALWKAITTWRKGADVMEQKYKAHYERARKNGHLDPQNTWMMQGLERGKSGLGASTWQLVSHASGMFAQASETVNRRTTLFAALDVAESMGQAKLEKLGFEDAYDFAVRAIQETQGIYNKGNRPRVARGNIGSVLMMYKQFMIAYLEQMSRMQKSGLYGGEDDAFKKNMAKMFGFGISRSVLVMLGILMSVSGATGLPFVRDILDGIETAGGLVGKPVNTEREVQIALHDALGQTLGGAVNTALMDGFVNLNPLIDVKGRMGMGDLIPATAYFSPTTSDYMKSAELANIAGPIGGLIEKVKESVALAQVGAYGQAGVQLLPKAVTSMGQGAIAATTGDYRNMKTGVKTNDATVLDGIIKTFDAQPAGIAKEGRIRGLEMKDKAAKTAVNARWKERYEAALDSGERASISAVKQEIKEYNQENPRYPVTFNKKTTETNYKKSNQKWQDKRKDAKGLEWMDAYNPYLSEE